MTMAQDPAQPPAGPIERIDLAAVEDASAGEDETASAQVAAGFAVGGGVRAVFPRMAGKTRPGLVTHIAEGGVIALPLTTRRTNQPGHFQMPDAEIAALGFEKRAHLLLPRAAYLPFERCAPAQGAVSELLLAQILGEMVEWYGLDWRARAPLKDPNSARLLHLRSKP
ncbi:MAG: hypothetical protein AAGM38_00695 [Pseudomonadota bacterium]